jgi:hypothetical protein
MEMRVKTGAWKRSKPELAPSSIPIRPPDPRPNMTPSRAAILRLINASQHSTCPCHGSHTSHNAHVVYNQLRRLATPVEKVDKEYAFEVCVPSSSLPAC